MSDLGHGYIVMPFIVLLIGETRLLEVKGGMSGVDKGSINQTKTSSPMVVKREELVTCPIPSSHLYFLDEISVSTSYSIWSANDLDLNVRRSERLIIAQRRSNTRPQP